MILKVSRGGRIVRKSHDNPDEDISEKAIEYLFDGVELDRDVTLWDILLILRKNPVLLNVFERLRAMEILENAFSGTVDEVSGYGVENIEYLELSWGWSSSGDGLFSIWPKMSMVGIGYELREPLQNDYADFPAGARQGWALEFCTPRELANYPLRIKSKIIIGPGCRTRSIDLGFPDLGKTIEAVLYCLSWFGSETDREGVKAEILKARAEKAYYEVDADDLIEDLEKMLDKIDEKEKI